MFRHRGRNSLRFSPLGQGARAQKAKECKPSRLKGSMQVNIEHPLTGRAAAGRGQCRKGSCCFSKPCGTQLFQLSACIILI